MHDEEILKMGYHKSVLQAHMSYKKRKRKTLSSSFSDSTESFEDVSTKEEEEEEEEERLVSIKARQYTKGNVPIMWLAVFSNGQERWLPEENFILADGSEDAIFRKFEEENDEEENVFPQIPLVVNKKRKIDGELKEIEEEIRAISSDITILVERHINLNKRFNALVNESK
jgi:prefoldin subunit 5